VNRSLTLTAEERERSLANLRLERDAIVLYDRLAGLEKDPRRKQAFRQIWSNEQRHAEVWASRLRDAGADVPPPERPRLRIRVIIGLARVFGTRAVSDLVRALEGDEEEIYEAQGDPDVEAIMADEREHAEIWHRLDAGLPPLVSKPGSAGNGHAVSETTAVEASAGDSVAATDDTTPARARASRRDESWHRAGQAGTLRAAIFGISDGLVSNLALVMGVAGASADNRFIVLSGVAGLLAGSFSMAAGEYISMQSQRELFQRQIDLEREELKIMPEDEERELAGIYRAKGLSASEAALVAHRLMQDPEQALDTKVREELGLDPDELGSPWGAATYSFLAFAIGALVPLLPFLLTTGRNAIVVSVSLALIALFIVGVGVSLLTGRSAIFSGLRQAAIGGAAAAVTYIVGLVIGVQFS
jgi:VIT1/CCC1 family predicted Fe2+/Mn2+ transporter